MSLLVVHVYQSGVLSAACVHICCVVMTRGNRTQTAFVCPMASTAAVHWRDERWRLCVCCQLSEFLSVVYRSVICLTLVQRASKPHWTTLRHHSLWSAASSASCHVLRVVLDGVELVFYWWIWSASVYNNIIIILFIMVKTQRSYSQQSVMQDSNYISNAYIVCQTLSW